MRGDPPYQGCIFLTIDITTILENHPDKEAFKKLIAAQIKLAIGEKLMIGRILFQTFLAHI